MTLLDNITKKVTETARAAARKSGDLVEVTKLYMSIGAEEDKIDKVYVQIGKVVYERYTEGKAIDEELKILCEEIKGYMDNISDMKQKIFELKKIKYCPACDTELDIEAAYCFRCGAKQEIPQQEVEKSDEKTCSVCGAVVSKDAIYCSKCGSKIE